MQPSAVTRTSRQTFHKEYRLAEGTRSTVVLRSTAQPAFEASHLTGTSQHPLHTSTKHCAMFQHAGDPGTAFSTDPLVPKLTKISFDLWMNMGASLYTIGSNLKKGQTPAQAPT